MMLPIFHVLILPYFGLQFAEINNDIWYRVIIEEISIPHFDGLILNSYYVRLCMGRLNEV